MAQKYDNLSIGFLDGNKVSYEHIKTGEEYAYDKIKQIILSQALVSLGATYGDESWAIDVACEKDLSYIVILDIKPGITYTYLNSAFLSGLRHDEFSSHDNILVCDDMEQFEEDEEHEEALEMVEINGNDCPMLHVCKEPNTLYQIIMHFLENGSVPADHHWLKS